VTRPAKMKSCTFLSILLSMAFAITTFAQGTSPVNNTVSIGNMEGNEVIVHVYRNKQDAFPFIEFSVTVDESTGEQIVDVTEVQGRTTDGGFMIISGVKRAGDVGVTASERYEISFSKVGDYRIYEKAVMEYLRRLPIPEIEEEISGDDSMDGMEFETEVTDVEIEVVAEEIDEEFENDEELTFSEELVDDIVDESPVPISGIKVDSNSVIVHVHRNSEDVLPFKEFVLTTELVNGEERVKATEAKDLQPQGKFMIITGFEEDSLGGVSKSTEYDAIPYNIYEYDHYEQAILDIMLQLSRDQFSGDESTIGLNWEKEIAVEEEVKEVKPAKPTMPDLSRKKKVKKPSQREINKLAKKLEQAKYKAPKQKDKYGVKKSKRMSARMTGNRKNTACPTFRRD